MSTAPNNLNVAYGLSTALLNVFPSPIIALRDPGAGDKAQFGTLWVNKTNNGAFVLTSIVNNAANWEAVTGGGGAFTSLTVTPGPIHLTGTTTINTTGNATTTIGNIVTGGDLGLLGTNVIMDSTGQVSIGALTATSIDIGLASTAPITLGNDNGITMNGAVGITGGTLTLDTGDVVATAGNITATAGTITAGSNITSSGGNIVATTGNITATAGSITAHTTLTATTGDITATAGDVVATAGNLIASAGDVNCVKVNLAGPVQILTGAGAPASGLAVETGDLYINTTASTTTTRLYIATGAGAWASFTASA